MEDLLQMAVLLIEIATRALIFISWASIVVFVANYFIGVAKRGSIRATQLIMFLVTLGFIALTIMYYPKWMVQVVSDSYIDTRGPAEQLVNMIVSDATAGLLDEATFSSIGQATEIIPPLPSPTMPIPTPVLPVITPMEATATPIPPVMEPTATGNEVLVTPLPPTTMPLPTVTPIPTPAEWKFGDPVPTPDR